MGAPVCPISRSQVLPGLPRQRPVVSPANDLPSLINADNTIKRILENMVGPGYPLSGAVGPTINTEEKKAPIVVVKQHWKEIRRHEKKERIIYKDSRGQKPYSDVYVDVVHIQESVFHYLYNNNNHPEQEFHWVYSGPPDRPLPYLSVI